MLKKMTALQLTLIVVVFAISKADQSVIANGLLKADFEYNGSKYHINSVGFYDRQLALGYCSSIFMNVVDLNGGSEEFTTLLDHINSTEFMPNTVGYWTSGLKNPAHDDNWIWETTATAIAEFYWGENQPHFPEESTYLCIYFSLQSRGWVDEDCFKTHLEIGVVCECKIEECAWLR